MATAVLFIWPVISIALFGLFGRERGLIWSAVVGYLLLPERLVYELPGLPDYDKYFAISFGLVVGALLFRHKSSFDFDLAAPPPRDMGAEVAAVWEEVLDTENIPRDKSFRELGGSERQARDTVRRLADIGMPMETARQLHENATIADLTKVVPEDGPRRLGARGLGVMLYVLLGLLMLAAVMTLASNPEDIVNGPRLRPGLTYRDVVSMVSGPLIAMVPFFLALRFLRSPTHQVEVMRAIVICGVFYAALAAFEARMSPQLNVWIYGYFQHSWVQHLRDGFRPIVFLSHGLSLGFFLLTAAIAGFALFRHLKEPVRFAYLAGGIWILLVLFISRNLGAAILAILFVPMVFLAPRFLQVRVAAACAALLLVYPFVWQSQILPIDAFMEFVTSISGARAQSLQTRLDNEAMLLARALEKPLFGWGAWGRWRVFNESGQDLTISDGIWIITLGERGWAGYLAFFGIITLPLFFLVRAVRIKERSHVVIGMALITAANLIYMIPNSTLTPVGWLMIGTIAGYVRWFVVEVEATKIPETAPKRSFSPYTRFAQDRSRGTGGGLSRG